MIDIKLLKITRNEHPELDELFEETERVDVEKVAPEVVEGQSNVRFNGSSVSEYDAVFAEIPSKNAVFGRVLLEMIEEKGIRVNYPSTAFFIMSKKNYLYHVLHEKNVEAPKVAVINSPKAVRNLEDELEMPVVARRLESYEETDTRKLESFEELNDFAEGEEDRETVLIFQELTEGEKYKCLIAGDQVISLRDTSEHWKIRDDNLQYSNLSSDLEELAVNAADRIGVPVAEVLIRDGQVVDMNPNPDLETYTEISGKNAYEAVASVLKGEQK